MAASWLTRMVDVREDEAEDLGWSFTYFFCLLAAYYVLQPLRDELGLAGGLENLSWLFIASMGLMLGANPVFSALVASMPRRRFIPLIYRFFLVNLVAFYALLAWGPLPWQEWIGRAFFLWVSVFNLFAVSVFWSFMADLFTAEQGRRLFGFIGAGGTIGQLAGSLLTATLATTLGKVHLLVFSLVLLELAVQAVNRLAARHPLDGEGESRPASCIPPGNTPTAPRPFSPLAGAALVLRSPYLIGICGYIFLYTFTSSFLYFSKAAIVKAALSDSDARTAFFGQLNTMVAGLTIFLQLFVSGRLLTNLGVGTALGLVPLITVIGFAGLYASPTLWVFAAVEVIRKAGNYAVARPSREVLFTVVDREEKYLAKNLIDTFIYRGGDSLAAVAFNQITVFFPGLGALSLAGMAGAGLWFFLARALGVAQAARERQRNTNRPPDPPVASPPSTA